MKNKAFNKLISLILTMVLLIASLHTSAGAVQIGSPYGLTMGSGNLTGDEVYFGEYNGSPLLWHVVGSDSETATLWTTASIANRRYDSTRHWNWSQSEICGWLNGTNSGHFLADAFTMAEQEAIVPYGTTEAANPALGNHTLIDISQKIVLPSVLEIGNTSNTGQWKITMSRRAFGHGWFLRSPGNNLTQAGYVVTNGGTGNRQVNNSHEIYPAFKIDLPSILFTSAAAGGKSNVSVGDGLVRIVPPTGAVKITLQNEEDLFLESNDTALRTVRTGDLISIAYTNAQTGANHYISGVITDSSGRVTHYGKLVDCNDGNGSGTVYFSVPDHLEVGSYTIKLFNERVNGDYYTDYAGIPVEIPMNVVGSTVSDASLTISSVTFGNETVGYTQPPAQTVLLENHGGVDAIVLNVALTGTHAEHFEMNGLAGRVPSNGSLSVLSVQPKVGLTPGNYTAQIAVTYYKSGSLEEVAYQTVSFAVEDVILPEPPSVVIEPNPVYIDIAAATTDQVVAVAAAEHFTGTVAYGIDGPPLPAGLALHVGTGTITVEDASQLTVGSFAVTIQAEDAASNTASETLTIEIVDSSVQALLILHTLENDTVAEEEYYSKSLPVTYTGSGTLSYTVASGTLPPGLLLDSAAGVLSGVPQPGASGIYFLTIEITDGVLSDSGSFVLTVQEDESIPPPAIGHIVTVNRSYAPQTGEGYYLEDEFVTIHAGSRKNYRFDGWVADGVNLSTPSDATTSFVMPGNPVTVTANWSYVNGGNGNDREDSDRSTGSSSPIIWVPKEVNMPTSIRMETSGQMNADRHLSMSITKKMIQQGMDEAKIKWVGRETHGIALIFENKAENIKSFTAVIESDAIIHLVSQGIHSITVQSGIFRYTLDKQAIFVLYQQSIGHVTASVTPYHAFGEAVAAISDRPAYTIEFQDGRKKQILDFGTGMVSMGIAYSSGNAATGSLLAVSVKPDGNMEWLQYSSYSNGWVTFQQNQLSVYGIGMKPAPNFIDTVGHWAQRDIDFAVSRELLFGTGDFFLPNQTVTRGMFITALGKLSKVEPSHYQKVRFSDVPLERYDMPYIEWAVKKRIVTGPFFNRFSPDTAITREEMAVLIKNYAKAIGHPLPVSRAYLAFEDEARINFFAKDAVVAVQQAGIINGREGNQFHPQGFLTKAEAAAVLHRFVELVIDERAARSWVKNDFGQWMYYDELGRRITGWLMVSETDITYYLDENGLMVSGKWIQIGGNWYYFYTDGKMARSTIIDGHKIDNAGIRQ